MRPRRGRGIEPGCRRRERSTLLGPGRHQSHGDSCREHQPGVCLIGHPPAPRRRGVPTVRPTCRGDQQDLQADIKARRRRRLVRSAACPATSPVCSDFVSGAGPQ